MFLSILSIPIFLLLCSYTPVVNGICEEPELSCYYGATFGYCTVRASNGSRTSYLINKCSTQLAETGITSINLYVYLTENNQTVTLDIAGGINIFYLYAWDSFLIEFNNTQMDIRYLYLYAYSPAVVCPYNFFNYFPSVAYLNIQSFAFDRFPILNSINLTVLSLRYLTLPDVVTILPSMLILPNLYSLGLYQSEDAQWFHVIPSSFENTRIDHLEFRGIEQLYSYQFANSTRLTYLHLSYFFNIFTFEENALSGLDGLTHLYTWYLQTNLDLVSKETFPSLIRFDLSYSSVTTLEQRFFERQKELSEVICYSVPFHCDCEMAWVSHVANNLDWIVIGTCETPSSLNGNSISDSSNYVNCSIQSYHCFNDSFICSPDSICVNTANSAYCECIAGYTRNATNNLCVDANECTGTNNCEHNCTNTVGSHTCSCLSGFTLQSDMSSCVSGVSQLTAHILLALLSLLLHAPLL